MIPFSLWLEQVVTKTGAIFPKEKPVFASLYNAMDETCEMRCLEEGQDFSTRLHYRVEEGY